MLITSMLYQWVSEVRVLFPFLYIEYDGTDPFVLSPFL